MYSSQSLAIAGTLLVGTLASAAETTLSPSVIARWDFEEPGNLQGFSVGQNVAEMTVADGCLRFKTVTNDPFIFAPLVQASLDGCVVRLAVRCRMASDTQVYWITPEYPNYGEQQVMNRYAPGRTEGFTILEFPIGKPSDAGRKLTGFRIDPCSGPVGEIGEIDYVELVRVPPLLEASLGFDRHRGEVNEPTRLALQLRQIAGWKDQSRRSVVIAGGPSVPAAEAMPQRAPAAHAELRFDKPGVHQQRALVNEESKAAAYDLETSIIAEEGDSLPKVAAIRTEHVRLDLVRAAGRDEVGAARFSVRDKQGHWRLAGWLLPLARLTVQTGEQNIVQREPLLQVHSATERWARLEGADPDLPDWKLQIDIAAGDKRGDLEVTALLVGPEAGRLLEFAAPALRVDREPQVEPLNRYAVFSGLEMLEPGWSSSSDRAVGERYAERHTPHPFKVSVPIMAVEAGGLTTGMLWQPTDNWDGQRPCPTATFASPNFLDGQPNHLMRLWVPGIPENVAENQLYAQRPYVMSRSQPLRLRYVLFVQPDAPAMVATQRWFETFGMPAAPPELYPDSKLYDLIAHSYGRTMYWPEQNGWTQHWFFEQPPGYQPEMAAFLIGHAADTGRQEWIAATRLSGRRLIQAGVPLATRVRQGDPLARAIASSMRADGTWPFQNTERIRKLALEVTNGKHDNLGVDGATELGVCANTGIALLRQAQVTGDPELIAAGVKALAAMRRFKVPRGAQVWEVHLEIPDIRAAALATEAFQIGYRLTGDTTYLDDASYWAWTGVPFIYAWRVPSDAKAGTFVGSRDRSATKRVSIPIAECYENPRPQVTPYGTLPVLGPTFYEINWFGVLVQWCGLEWAEKVLELDADRPDPLLRAIADGVVASGLQQMMDKEPWVGLYPDSWLLEQNIAQPAMIYPGLILACRQAQGRLPAWSKPWTRVVASDEGTERWHVSGWGKPISLGRPDRTSWATEVQFIQGEPNELVLARVPRPRAVTAGKTVLTPAEDQAQVGWTYDATARMVFIRFTQAEALIRVRVDW